MIIALFLICFLLNIFNHGEIFIGILNSILLLSSIYFYLQFTHKKLSIFKISFTSFPLIFMAAMPLMTQTRDSFITILGIGASFLSACYFTYKFKKILLLITALYLLFSSLYVSGIVKPLFSYQVNNLIITDDRANLYISRLRDESLYLPYKLRLMLFNKSVYLYVILSKIAGFFTIKNLYDTIYLANLYPLVLGIILDLKSWNRSKMLIIISIMFVIFISASSRSVNILNTFTLLSPFLIYFILRGFSSVNRTLYLALFFLSIIIATSPLK